MSAGIAWRLPERHDGVKGNGPPPVDPLVDTCAECGDFIAWCPEWTKRWPILAQGRDDERSMAP